MILDRSRVLDNLSLKEQLLGALHDLSDQIVNDLCVLGFSAGAIGSLFGLYLYMLGIRDKGSRYTVISLVGCLFLSIIRGQLI